MKRLVDLSDLANGQYKELIHLLGVERISVHETKSHFMDYAAIWVSDDDFPRAREMLRKEALAFSVRARAKWERQWHVEHKGSTVRWFAHRLFRSPAGTITRVLLLVVMVGLFVFYPLWHVVRATI